MLTCPTCGTANAPERRSCSACGSSLHRTPPLGSSPAAAPVPAPNKVGAGTLIGLNAAQFMAPPPAGAAAEGQRASLGATMLGIAPPPPGGVAPAPAPPAGTAPPARFAANQTLLGMPSPVHQPGPQPAQEQALRPEANPFPYPAPATPFLPQPTAPHDPFGEAALAPRSLAPAAAAPTVPARPLASQQKTMMGLAHPGIVPLASLPVAAPQPSFTPPAAAAPAAPQSSPVAAPQTRPAAPSATPTFTSPAAPRTTRAAPPRRSVAWAAWLLVGLALALVGSLGVLLTRNLLLRQRPVSAELVSTDDGEALDLTCADCANGSTVALGAHTAKFDGARARLALAKPLQVGKSTLALQLTRLGQESTDVEIDVEVAWRVRGELGGLSAERPRLAVAFELAEGASVSVEGRALAVTARKALWEEDVTEKLAANPAPSALERRVRYEVTVAGRATRGEVLLRTAVTKLQLRAPLAEVIVDQPTFVVAGQTEPNALLTVGGKALVVGSDGRFSQTLSVSAIGEASIDLRAGRAGEAPRIARLQVRRVASLAEELKRLAPTATAGLAAAKTKGVGTLLLLEGAVEETRVDEPTFTTLIDARRECAHPPCLCRVDGLTGRAPKQGASITVFARLEEQRGEVPSARAMFWVPGKALP